MIQGEFKMMFKIGVSIPNFILCCGLLLNVTSYLIHVIGVCVVYVWVERSEDESWKKGR